MRVFLDTEFTGLHQETTLVSIGLVAENGESFYGEVCDFAVDQCDDWIEKHVIKNLFLEEKAFKAYKGPLKPTEFERAIRKGVCWHIERIDTSEDPEIKKECTMYYGTSNRLVKPLTEWFNNLSTEEGSIEIVSDCLAYDMVLFNQIWGHSFNVPKCIHYIYTDICTMFRDRGINPDINREEFSEFKNKTNVKHNSFYDAIIIMLCYYKLKGAPIKMTEKKTPTTLEEIYPSEYKEFLKLYEKTETESIPKEDLFSCWLDLGTETNMEEVIAFYKSK